jgi:uncharacterized SAM-binding protein YcdF (DUF218 family)
MLRLIRLALWVGLVTMAAVLGSAFLSRPCTDLVTEGARFDTAVVLGGGGEVEGLLLPDSHRRAESAALLYREGIVEHIHFTGFAGGPSPRPAAVGMREVAVDAGVPVEATSIEGESKSTLENALFSRPMLEDAGRLVLVSDGFHLWRGAASMAWAGRPVEGMCKSASLTEWGDHQYDVVVVLREMAAWWLNIVRGGIYSVANTLGVADSLPEGFME